MDALSTGTPVTLTRPCDDCGLWPGCFFSENLDCNFCLAATRMPLHIWGVDRLTPFCARCDSKWGLCHDCRDQVWCNPPVWRISTWRNYGSSTSSRRKLKHLQLLVEVDKDADPVTMDVLSTGAPETLTRPCDDCGLWTGCFFSENVDCTFCLAATRIPFGNLRVDQLTPFCTQCDSKGGRCHNCYGQVWCKPPVQRNSIGSSTSSWHEFELL